MSDNRNKYRRTKHAQRAHQRQWKDERNIFHDIRRKVNCNFRERVNAERQLTRLRQVKNQQFLASAVRAASMLGHDIELFKIPDGIYKDKRRSTMVYCNRCGNFSLRSNALGICEPGGLVAAARWRATLESVERFTHCAVAKGDFEARDKAHHFMSKIQNSIQLAESVEARKDSQHDIVEFTGFDKAMKFQLERSPRPLKKEWFPKSYFVCRNCRVRGPVLPAIQKRRCRPLF